jgi:predicted phosphodiesterase
VRIAVLSDIHSNFFALQAVLHEVEQSEASEVWICGDTFGYYPWASDTFSLLPDSDVIAVLGNHDAWVDEPDSAPKNIVGEIARKNAADLAEHSPAALGWLRALALTQQLERDAWQVTMVHGTPDDPLNGRYYPDDSSPHPWLPGASQILVLGQTHYPLCRGNARDGLLLNPGSVGQPRDRNPMASWAILDLETGRAELRRTRYDNIGAMSRLLAIGWDDRVVRSLDKK